MINVLSYGAGIQTFSMLLMVRAGDLPMPNIAVFADTQNEKPQTYQHIEEIVKPVCNEIGLEFVTISKGNLKTDLMAKNYNPMPPVCSLDYKVRPINKYLKDRFALANGITGGLVWIGITTDESNRNTQSAVKYIEKKYPLLEKNLSRQDCIEYISRQGYSLPVKSGCVFCPHNSTRSFLQMKQNNPDWFNSALEIETNARLVHRAARLPAFGMSLEQINNQMIMELDFSSESYIDTDNCTAGYCVV